MSYGVTGNPAPRQGMHRLIAPIAMAGLLASGCSPAATAIQTGTSASATPSVLPSVAPSPATASVAPITTVATTETASDTAGPTGSSADRTPPAMLPHGNTGVILYSSECFDLDDWGKGANPDCDLYLDSALIFNPINGTVMAQKGRGTPPSMLTCEAENLIPSPVTPGLDSYFCLRTSDGIYGYVVQRLDRPTAPSGRITIDYWLYK